jgi:riboflavin synthase
MFTGIVEETGKIEHISKGSESIDLLISLGICGTGLKKGDSLAINGCCLTVVKISRAKRKKVAAFNLLRETWRRTNLHGVKPGSLVNLERSMAANGRFGGHFVTGHIDGLGKITRWETVGNDHLLEISAAPSIMRYVFQKGSITVDGISLTLAAVKKTSFQVWIIPHTYEVTALHERKVGDLVNVETDVIGKYVEKFLSSSAAAR